MENHTAGIELVFHAVLKSKIRTLCCKECRELEEDQLDDIVQYLKKYPNSNALQISEELGIHPYEILKFMEEGWLGTVQGEFSRLPDEEQEKKDDSVY